MLVSQTAEYALRAMAYLATLENGAAVRALDLSEATAIPPHYLSKILRRLVLHDLLLSRKGHGGGFTLARPRDQIRFLDILAAADAAPSENVCAFGWGSCDSQHPCPLHDSWNGMNQEFLRWARETTLADVTSLSDATMLARTGRPRS